MESKERIWTEYTRGRLERRLQGRCASARQPASSGVYFCHEGEGLGIPQSDAGRKSAWTSSRDLQLRGWKAQNSMANSGDLLEQLLGCRLVTQMPCAPTRLCFHSPRLSHALVLLLLSIDVLLLMLVLLPRQRYRSRCQGPSVCHCRSRKGFGCWKQCHKGLHPRREYLEQLFQSHCREKEDRCADDIW